MLNLNSLLATAIKEQNQVAMRVLRDIKSQISKAETQKSGVTITDALEASIILKMIKQRKDSLDAFIAANRTELAESEQAEIVYLESLGFKQVTMEEIESTVISVMSTIKASRELSIKDMREVMDIVKSTHPLADGKDISNIFRCKLSQI